MKRTTQYITTLALLPLFVLLAAPMSVANAQSNQDVCGTQLCSEIPGGRDAWLKDPGRYFPSDPGTPVLDTTSMLSCTIDGTLAEVEISLLETLSHMLGNTMMNLNMTETNPSMSMEGTAMYSSDCMTILQILGAVLTTNTSDEMIDTMMESSDGNTMMEHNMKMGQLMMDLVSDNAMKDTMMERMNDMKMSIMSGESEDNAMMQSGISCTIKGTHDEITADLSDTLTHMFDRSMISPNMMNVVHTYNEDCMKLFHLLANLMVGVTTMDTMMMDMMDDNMMSMMQSMEDKAMTEMMDKDKKYDKMNKDMMSMIDDAMIDKMMSMMGDNADRDAVKAMLMEIMMSMKEKMMDKRYDDSPRLSCTIDGTLAEVEISLLETLSHMLGNTMMNLNMTETNPSMSMEGTAMYSSDCMTILQILGAVLTTNTSDEMIDTMMESSDGNTMMEHNMKMGQLMMDLVSDNAMKDTMMERMNDMKMSIMSGESEDNAMMQSGISCTIKGTHDEITADLSDTLTHMFDRSMISPNMMNVVHTYNEDCMKLFHLLANLMVGVTTMDTMMMDMMDDNMMSMMQSMEDKAMTEMMDKKPSELRLSRANVPATIPLHLGYFDGDSVYYIITDSSDQELADTITSNQEWKVELAPPLAFAPDSAVSTTYMFSNGIDGDGVNGFQGEVFSTTPAQEEYSALARLVQVSWNDGVSPRILNSADMVMAAASSGQVTLLETDLVVNMPQIVWPDGQMMVKEDKILSHDTPYGGGQVLDIDTDDMTVTFIAHRGWGPDGSTIYYIVTDATPSDPAAMMGVISAPTSANLIANAAAVDLFQFKNGLQGSGPLGFQPGIAAAAPGSDQYSPMWRIYMAGWVNPDDALLLETIDDLNTHRQSGMITVDIARPMNSDHIVNCPFIDPFQ